MPKLTDVAGQELIDACHNEAIELLRRNLSADGILAATPGDRARSRGYTAIFGRDAAICALGMALSGDPLLERAARIGLETLGEHQAPNGQIPKFVERGAREAHQRFFLLQQNEASDWADIMPRSGFVLYSNALWYAVKCRYGLDRADDTRANFNGLFHAFSAGLARYRRARLLNEYVLRRARNRDLYLSFVNFSFFGEEGDVFGNLLAVLCGLPSPQASRRTLAALQRARVSRLYPVRVVTRPIRRRSRTSVPGAARARAR